MIRHILYIVKQEFGLKYKVKNRILSKDQEKVQKYVHSWSP